MPNDLTTVMESLISANFKPGKLFKFILGVGLILCAHVSHAKRRRAAGEIYALYQNPTAGTGVCLPRINNADAILKRNGITTIGATDGEREALAKGIAQVERLLGRSLPASWRPKYNFVNEAGAWNQGAVAINVRRGAPDSAKGRLTGRMMHELGHKIGNSGEYAAYRSYIGGNSCDISPYATKKHNEEFAEVFEAFVVYPELLKQKCPDSYAFFKQKLFPSSGSKLASCNQPGGSLIAQQDPATVKKHAYQAAPQVKSLRASQ